MLVGYDVDEEIREIFPEGGVQITNLDISLPSETKRSEGPGSTRGDPVRREGRLFPSRGEAATGRALESRNMIVIDVISKNLRKITQKTPFHKRHDL
jgi:hypothetical protein